jgi:hypothetical protein|tara:strand:- start:2610 stop:2855 length:246 start_codon:yes stop_codon:yes gene_type:complete
MALKCRLTAVEARSELALKNAEKRKESGCLLGSKLHFLQGMPKAGLMRQNLMSTNTGCIQFAKRLDAQTYTIVGVEGLQLS